MSFVNKNNETTTVIDDHNNDAVDLINTTTDANLESMVSLVIKQ